MRLLTILLLALPGLYGQALPLQNARICATRSGLPEFPANYSAFSVYNGTSLRKHVLTSPEAVCNDGTPAIIYGRRAVAGATEPDGGLANNRWVIVIQGGGICSNSDDCTERWCGTGFYDASKMSSRYNPDTILDTGILNRNPANRLGNRNQVFAYYCSSDGWIGTQSNSLITDPDDPTRSFTLNFKGSRIVDAIFTDLENGMLDLPRITDATDAIIAGDSAGAMGVRQNVDRIAARLRQRNPNVKVRAVLDATFTTPQEGKSGKPPGDPTDPFTMFFGQAHRKVQIGVWGGLHDQSCLAMHSLETQFLCSQQDHLEKNHITTPFFQAMDLADPKLAEGHVAENLYPTFTSMSQAQFDQLTALSSLLTTAEEKAQMTTVPGVAGRLCYQHVALEITQQFFLRQTRATADGPAFSFHDLLVNWMFGGGPVSVIAPRPPDSPPVPIPDSLCNQPLGGTTAPGADIVSAATYAREVPVAPESLAIALLRNVPVSAALVVAPTDNWPTTLGGVRLTVTDSSGTARAAPIYYVHPTQIAFLIPAGTAVGAATVTFTAAANSFTSPVTIAAVSPGFYTASQSGVGVVAGQWVRVAANGNHTSGLLFDANRSAMPVDLGNAGDQVYLQVYGTGLRFATSGSVTVGGIRTAFIGPVPQGQFLGLDQLNIGPLSRRLAGQGDVDIEVRANGLIANVVTVRIK
jgi:uncharacterized protein (TIGR03437 family)